MRSFAPAVLVVWAFAFVAAEAHAQESGFVERRTSQGQEVSFEDDPMTALTGDPIENMFRVGYPRARRLDLMRPRRSFVTEMLKSVESL
jgi:hypothetical protein